MKLAPGETLGPYLRVERASTGGRAEVWKVYQPRPDRYVAVKVVPRHLAAEPSYLDRFEREARVVSRLDRPNILSVFDFGGWDGFTYVVSPFIEGGALEARIGRPWTGAGASTCRIGARARRPSTGRVRDPRQRRATGPPDE